MDTLPPARAAGDTMKRWLTIASLAMFGFWLIRGDEVDVSKLPPASATVDFAKDVQPLLESSCLKCHGGAKPKAKFSLETRALALKGGEDAVAIARGASEDSEVGC